MSDVVETAGSLDFIRDVLSSSRFVIPVGNRTKRCLGDCEGATAIEMAGHAGMIDYEPSEFTFTAKAGTTLREVIDVLADRNQYLPFDPMLVGDASAENATPGATLGGTIAAGLSGPGRFRFGGVRDFLLGATLVLSNGDAVRVGGKVVKNAAGFDVPKLMIGSTGRLAVIADVTMKVFPRPAATLTVFGRCQSHREAFAIMATLARSTMELDAIDYDVTSQTVWLRAAGPVVANDIITNPITRILTTAEVAEPDVAQGFWASTCELNWSAGSIAAMKVPTTLACLPALVESLDGSPHSVRVSAAGHTTWICFADTAGLDRIATTLCSLGLGAMLIRASSALGSRSSWFGRRKPTHIAEAVQRAIDPLQKFPPLMDIDATQH